MKKLSFLLFAICVLFVSCNSEESTKEQEEIAREKDYAKLKDMHDDIVKFSLSTTLACSNPEEWGIIRIDISRCAENGGYIAYSKKIDVVILQKKIDEYTKAKGEIYTKWGVLIDMCNYSIPTSVKCVNNKPELSSNSSLN